SWAIPEAVPSASVASPPAVRSRAKRRRMGPNPCTQRRFGTARANPCRGGLSEASLELPLDLPAHVPVGDLAAPVAPLLAAGERELDLCARRLEVDPRRDQGQPALLRLAD